MQRIPCKDEERKSHMFWSERYRIKRLIKVQILNPQPPTKQGEDPLSYSPNLPILLVQHRRAIDLPTYLSANMHPIKTKLDISILQGF